MNWWALSNASSIMQIRLAIHEILADKAFTATDGLISQSFVVAFVHPTYVWIALIWGFPAQLSLWKSVYWLWRYKLNEVCDILQTIVLFSNSLYSFQILSLNNHTNLSADVFSVVTTKCVILDNLLHVTNIISFHLLLSMFIMVSLILHYY